MIETCMAWRGEKGRRSGEDGRKDRLLCSVSVTWEHVNTCVWSPPTAQCDWLSQVWDRYTSKARLGVLVCQAEPSAGS